MDQNFWQNLNFHAILLYFPACLNFYTAISWPARLHGKSARKFEFCQNFGPHFCTTSLFSIWRDFSVSDNLEWFFFYLTISLLTEILVHLKNVTITLQFTTINCVTIKSKNNAYKFLKTPELFTLQWKISKSREPF